MTRSLEQGSKVLILLALLAGWATGQTPPLEVRETTQSSMLEELDQTVTPTSTPTPTSNPTSTPTSTSTSTSPSTSASTSPSTWDKMESTSLSSLLEDEGGDLSGSWAEPDTTSWPLELQNNATLLESLVNSTHHR